jgi:hypothetical protein
LLNRRFSANRCGQLQMPNVDVRVVDQPGRSTPFAGRRDQMSAQRRIGGQPPAVGSRWSQEPIVEASDR